MKYKVGDRVLQKVKGRVVTITDLDLDDDVLTYELNNSFWVKEDEILHDKYEYAKTDFEYPDWWDGRPIKGKSEYHDECYLIGIDFTGNDLYPYCIICKNKEGEWRYWQKRFMPTEKAEKTVKLTITENGKSREVELTEDQIKRLGV